jgi:acyl-CoA synthetase (AMP-forming)/AMP-acid ligase II
MKERLFSGETIEHCPPAVRASSVAELLYRRACEQPDDTAFVFFGFGQEDDCHLDYRTLDRRANALALLLREQGVGRNDRVLLIYPSSRDFVEAFFACLYLGCIAVPAPLPENEQERRRLAGMIADAQPRLVMCRGQDIDFLSAYLAQEGHATLCCIDTTQPRDTSERVDCLTSGQEQLAFLQYTSGSTSAPKGVMVSHGNLLHNLELIKSRLKTDEGRCLMLSWLPHFHDMGLIGGILHPIHLGRPVIYLSTLSFLQQPMRWLRMMSDYRVTHSIGPNFAYELCLRRSKRANLDDLDLSSWRVAFTGAEPVRHETLLRFSERFAPTGFKLDSFCPGYGLAEATLMVTGKQADQPLVARTVGYQALVEGGYRSASGGERALTLVSSGNVRGAMQDVFICSEDGGEVLPPGRIGEICVRGESVCQGYWGKPEMTEETFRAYADRLGGQGAMRTGDLGFVDDAGELFVTGRLKDVVIAHGANHYPQDIELLVEEADSRVREGRVAVFNLNVEGETGVLAVCEVSNQSALRDDLEIQAANLVEAVRQGCGVQLGGVVFIRKGTIPKTSSGKIQRRECRQRYLRGELDILHERYAPAWGDAVRRLRGSVDAADGVAQMVV